jgi:hypothetical protein
MAEKPRIECTEAAPWDRKTPAYVVHHGAEENGDQESGWPGGDIVPMRCRFCGHEWEKELPQ